jgi:hypothetical protein
VCFQRIGGKLDAFAAKMQPIHPKNRGKIAIFFPPFPKMSVNSAVFSRRSRSCYGTGHEPQPPADRRSDGARRAADDLLLAGGAFYKIFLHNELRAVLSRLEGRLHTAVHRLPASESWTLRALFAV